MEGERRGCEQVMLVAEVKTESRAVTHFHGELPRGFRKKLIRKTQSTILNISSQALSVLRNYQEHNISPFTKEMYLHIPGTLERFLAFALSKSK